MSEGELRDGEVYFAVQFIDDDRLLPSLDPIVFIGRNLEPGDEGRVYFQDAASYRAGVRYDSEMRDTGLFYGQEVHEIKHIFEFERALDVLLRCSKRRHTAPRSL